MRRCKFHTPNICSSLSCALPRSKSFFQSLTHEPISALVDMKCKQELTLGTVNLISTIRMIVAALALCLVFAPTAFAFSRRQTTCESKPNDSFAQGGSGSCPVGELFSDCYVGLNDYTCSSIFIDAWCDAGGNYCPKGCYRNEVSGNFTSCDVYQSCATDSNGFTSCDVRQSCRYEMLCVQCEWPFTTNALGDNAFYCDGIQFVKPDDQSNALITVISLSIFVLLFTIVPFAWKDKEVMKISFAASMFSFFDLLSDVSVLLTTEFYNMVYYPETIEHKDVYATGLSPYTIVCFFFIVAFITPNIDFIRHLVRIKAYSRLNYSLPLPKSIVTDEKIFGSYYAYIVCHVCWTIIVSIPMIPWLLYGFFLFQTHLMGIKRHWNMWISIWSGNENHLAPEGDDISGKVNAMLLRDSYRDHIFLSSLPMFILLSINMQLAWYVVQPNELISLVLSGIIIISGIFEYIYHVFYEGKKWEEKDVEISIAIVPAMFSFKGIYIMRRVYDCELLNESEDGHSTLQMSDMQCQIMSPT